LIRHREPPLGGAAIQGGASGAEALDCFATRAARNDDVAAFISQ
jgi:hypothetical protein